MGANAAHASWRVAKLHPARWGVVLANVSLRRPLAVARRGASRVAVALTAARVLGGVAAIAVLAGVARLLALPPARILAGALEPGRAVLVSTGTRIADLSAARGGPRVGGGRHGGRFAAAARADD